MKFMIEHSRKEKNKKSAKCNLKLNVTRKGCARIQKIKKATTLTVRPSFNSMNKKHTLMKRSLFCQKPKTSAIKKILSNIVGTR